MGTESQMKGLPKKSQTKGSPELAHPASTTSTLLAQKIQKNSHFFLGDFGAKMFKQPARSKLSCPKRKETGDDSSREQFPSTSKLARANATGKKTNIFKCIIT